VERSRADAPRVGRRFALRGAEAVVGIGEHADPASSNPIADFIQIFIGNGTAPHPNAGILLGNGYSYTGYAGACTSGACNGGRGGLVGNGGNGYAGGMGGAAGWFGNGGNGLVGAPGAPGNPGTKGADG
jgi:hypothetical protein